jgi:LytS/YehU family sensor histidine kinase
VEVQFVTPYFHNPAKLRYRYKLEGLDQDWLHNGPNNHVRFSALAPGNYRFRVSATVDGEHWYESKESFQFTIVPPFWQRVWFIALGILLAAGLIYWAVQKRLAAIQASTKLKEHIAEIEMRALRAQMNPHFIFNCLNSINRYIVKSDHATASLYLTRFSKLIRLILDNSNSKSILLSNELEALKLYIEMEALRFDHRFTYDVSLANDIHSDSIEVPPLIVQPYVENAIWHGLLHKENGGHLQIDLSMNGENELLFIVEDDGVGREKAKEFKSKSATTKKSLGLKLTEDRIAVLNKYAKHQASVKIVDVIKNGIVSGTRVSITIPV